MAGRFKEFLLLLPLFSLCNTQGYQPCQQVKTIDLDTTVIHRLQPIFVTLMPKTPENVLIDNMCFTYFALPDDPFTQTGYLSRVFCDGSHDIESFIETTTGYGFNTRANPTHTVTDYIVDYAGCDNFLVYDCTNFGEYTAPYIFTASTQAVPLGLSCLRRVEELIRENGLTDQDFYVLPMKLPNRCVTQQLCLLPPNPFYKQLINSRPVVL